MQISFFGPDNNFFTTAFFDNDNGFDVDLVSGSSTQIVVRQPVTEAVTTITGTGFTFGSDGNPNGGTITGVNFGQGTTTVATFAEISWGLFALFDAIDDIDIDDDYSAFDALLNLQPLTLDASAATSGFRMPLDLFSELTQDNKIIGSAFNDILLGGMGNDTIQPGDNEGYDVINISAGNDLIDFSTITPGSSDNFFEIRADGLNLPTTFNVDAVASMITAVTSTGTTTLNSVERLLDWDENFVGFVGSSQSDTFNYTAADGHYASVSLLGGNDTFNISGANTTTLRLDYRGGAQTGIVADLGTGAVSDDGQGGSDQINFTSDGDRGIDLRGTSFADMITGTAKNDRFIGAGSNDTIDGGDGFDLVRLDRSRIDAAGNVDLAAGTISSSWEGTAFTMSVSNIEHVRGNDNFDDVMRGNAADEQFDGYGGNDTLNGGAGSDTLYGGEGNDLLTGGEGRDRIYAWVGDDVIDLSVGSAESQGFGDIAFPGLGQDTVVGHQGLFDNGGGSSLSYGDLSGVGGVTIRVQEDGSGTASSGNAGLINDTFTGVNFISGSADADLLVGHDGDRYQGFETGPGNDTVEGGSGTQDTLDYRFWNSATQGITVDMAAGTVIEEFGGTDTFSGIERFEGTRFADTMTAATTSARFSGNGGDDILIGGSADDTLIGGAGNDKLVGGGGEDTAVFDFAFADATTGVVEGVLSLTQSGETDIVDDDVETLEFTDRTISYAEAFGDAMPEDPEGPEDLVLTGTAAGERLQGGEGNDSISGLDGPDTLIGNGGNDTIIGGTSESDLRDVIFGGAGNDSIEGGYGNDELRGDAGNDSIAGGFGADTVIGGTGDDVLTGSAFGDNLFGGDGNDFVNGGFGSDRVNGGTGADEFYHIGVAGHGSDWIQDYDAAEGDVLVFGNTNATRAQFQINVATTPSAGEAGVDEAFVIFRPTGQIIWALVDGNGQDEINLKIGGEIFDLTA